MTRIPDTAYVKIDLANLPAGVQQQRIAVDSVHAAVVKAAPWAPATVVLNGDPDQDLVLVAVPKGEGHGMALFLADQLVALDGATALEGKQPS